MKVKEDDKVYYHPLLGRPSDGRVYSVLRVGKIPSCKNDVAWLEGKAGCIDTRHLSPAIAQGAQL